MARMFKYGHAELGLIIIILYWAIIYLQFVIALCICLQIIRSNNKSCGYTGSVPICLPLLNLNRNYI